jgi:hypothetical protein
MFKSIFALAILVLAALSVAGCSNDVSETDCSYIASQAIDASKGQLVSIADQTLTSSTPERVVCHGNGTYSDGTVIPTRFQTYTDANNQTWYSYDVSEYETAKVNQIEEQAEQQQRQLVQNAEQEYPRIALTRCKDGSGVSTISIPIGFGHAYETAVCPQGRFSQIEVVAEYDDLTSAREGHQRHVRAGGGPAFFQFTE